MLMTKLHTGIILWCSFNLEYYLFIQYETYLCTYPGLTKLVDPIKETDSSSAPE